MFDLEKFRTAAHNGDLVDLQGLTRYLNSFEHIILWGAGNLGTVIGRKFAEMKWPVTAYWDLRSQDIGSLNGVRVLEPFTGGFAQDKTLVVFCITNVFISSVLVKQLADKGYRHVITGEDMYQGIICPFSSEEDLDIRVCRDLPVCNVCTCKRLDNIIRRKNERKSIFEQYENLHFPNITFVINQKCTLSCEYCYSYMNNYPSEDRINFPLERIREDIDRFFNAVDSVTLVPVIGGEPFLHPDISEIVKTFLKKKNFGVLNVTTNGICKISGRQLEGFHDDRARVFFSNYLDCLTPSQVELFHKNIDFVRSQGVATVVYNTTPQWTVPVTLNDKHHSDAQIVDMKSRCMMNPTNGKYVKNGFFYPCTIIDSVHNLHLADYPDDYLEISGTTTDAELRALIREIMDRPYYRTCRHCGDRGQLTEKAGVQGYRDYTHR